MTNHPAPADGTLSDENPYIGHRATLDRYAHRNAMIGTPMIYRTEGTRLARAKIGPDAWPIPEGTRAVVIGVFDFDYPYAYLLPNGRITRSGGIGWRVVPEMDNPYRVARLHSGTEDGSLWYVVSGPNDNPTRVDGGWIDRYGADIDCLALNAGTAVIDENGNIDYGDPCDCGTVIGPNGGYVPHAIGAIGCTGAENGCVLCGAPLNDPANIETDDDDLSDIAHKRCPEDSNEGGN